MRVAEQTLREKIGVSTNLAAPRLVETFKSERVCLGLGFGLWRGEIARGREVREQQEDIVHHGKMHWLSGATTYTLNEALACCTKKQRHSGFNLKSLLAGILHILIISYGEEGRAACEIPITVALQSIHVEGPGDCICMSDNGDGSWGTSAAASLSIQSSGEVNLVIFSHSRSQSVCTLHHKGAQCTVSHCPPFTGYLC